MVRTLSFHCRRNRIQTLAGELSSHKPSGAAKKKKKKNGLYVTLCFFYVFIFKQRKRGCFSTWG